MLVNRPKTKILLDSGDPDETRQIKELLGYLDGQTTNPSLVAKNPEVQRRIAGGKKLSVEEQNKEYREIVRQISPLVSGAGVSIEVYADLVTKAEAMLAQGEEMFTWIPNAYIKYPCTEEGLKAAEAAVRKGIRVNITLCFSQEQAAAVYSATRDTKAPVYVSPFIGRLDDRGENGMDVIRNIKKMYAKGDGHVHVLAASIRRTSHLLESFALNSELATVPGKVLRDWADKGFPLPDKDFHYSAVDADKKPLKPIPYLDLDLNSSWKTFNIQHDLTTAGIEKFTKDYKATVAV